MPDPIFDSALLSMCMTWRHDFGLLDRKEQIAIRKELLGLYERHVKPAIIRAKAAEFTAHTFSIACDAHKRRAERAESILLDESMDHKTHGFCDCPLCKFAESIAPPADASTMGGEREPAPYIPEPWGAPDGEE